MDCIITQPAGVLRELSKDAGPHLVVVPASLIENWQRELERWCPKLEVVTYYGKDRAEIRANLNALRCSTGISQYHPRSRSQ